MQPQKPSTESDQRDTYLENGYLHLKKFYAPQRVEVILNQAKHVFLSQMKRLGLDADLDINHEETFRSKMAEFFERDFEAFANCGKQVQHLMSLHRLSLDMEIEALLNFVGLHQPNICTRPVLYFNHPSLAKEAVYHTVFAHQDWPSMQGSLDSVVIWCPLVDIDDSLGALRLVEGSHRLGVLTESVEAGFAKVSAERFGPKDWTSVEVNRGDLLLFNAFLVHQSGNNQTDRIRWSCHFRYNNLSDPTFIERGYHHNYIYQPKSELRTPDFPTESDLLTVFREDGG